MKRVQVGQDIIEFPPDMPDADIERILSEQYAAPKQAEPASREQLSQGATLKLGPFDTGIGLPPQVTETLAGAGRRFMDIATLGNRPTKDAAADKALDSSGWASAGSAGADLATLVGGGAALRGVATMPQVVSKLPQFARIGSAIGQNMIAPTSVRNAAATAGLYGAATQEGDVGTRALSGATQGAFGAAGQAIPNLIGAAIKPKFAPDVEALRAAGVRMTPGQMGPAWMNVTEQKAMSLPILGDAIRGARTRSIEDFNRATANQVLAPLGKKATQPAGRQLVEEVQGILSQSYDDVLPRLKTTYNQPIDAAIDEGKDIAAQAGMVDRFEAVMKRNFFGKFKDASGTIDGATFKEVDSGLAEAARNARFKGDTELAEATEGVRKALRATAQGSKDDLAKLADTDAAYARLVRMENAAASRGAKDGVFTPAQLGRATEKQAGRKTKAAGRELMGEFADNAERRLSTTFPNSGTADRLLLGGVSGAALAGLDPTYLAAAAAAASAYTTPGQAMMRGLLMRPEALTKGGDAMRRLAPAGGLLAPYLLPVYAGQQ